MTSTTTVSDPELIEAVPLRHTGRWIAATIVLILVGLFIYGAATNDAFDWSTYGKYLFDKRISQAAVVTLELTVLAMLLGIVLGVVLAVMRLSPNPVLRSTAWVYLWIFRGTPVYVQLVFWGLFTSIYRLAKMRERFVRYEELLVFGPPKLPFGFANRVFTRRIAVCLACALGWHPKTNHRLH